MTFQDYVKQYIADRLAADFLLDQIGFGLLRDIVEDCFLAKGFTLTPAKKAESILSALFSLLVRGFDFTHFLEKISRAERTQFLSTLLYHIYYLYLPIKHLATQESLFFYLFQTYALLAKEKNIVRLYLSQDPALRLGLIHFCLENFEEGAYRILAAAYKCDTAPIKKLLGYIERKLIAAKSFSPPRDLEQFFTQADKEIRRATKEVQKASSITYAEAERFVSVFGLYDLQTQDISSHARALSHSPERYIEGVETITFALPTKGKQLSLYPWLSSMTQALDYFCSHFEIKNNIPIFIFDQSDAETFAHNSSYIKTFGKNVIHLDSTFMLHLAKVLKIEKLLVTDDHGQFGYGGARNAIFLITPLLRQYFSEKWPKKRTFQDYCLQKDPKVLRRDFRTLVLESKSVIHMGDDDIHVPIATIFSDALFAYEHKDEYFCRFGWVTGRRTTWTETTFNLEFILERASDVLLQHSWQDTPFRHGMAGLLTKPKICMNLPFGQEEGYLLPLKEYLVDVRQPMLHLSGLRLPTAKIPTNRLSGLADCMLRHYRATFGSLLVSDLLDPENAYRRCSLPWNLRKKCYASLQDAMADIIRAATIKKMQTDFQRNLKHLSKGLTNYEKHKYEASNLALFHLSVLQLQDVDAILEKYRRFPKELLELKALFKELAFDATCFKEVLEGSKKRYPEKRLFMTHALRLMMRVVETASFQKILAKL